MASFLTIFCNNFVETAILTNFFPTQTIQTPLRASVLGVLGPLHFPVLWVPSLVGRRGGAGDRVWIRTRKHGRREEEKKTSRENGGEKRIILGDRA